MELQQLTIQIILEWADEHIERTGNRPTRNSGLIKAAKGEKWAGVDYALRQGARGLPGGSTLAQLLAEHRGVRRIR
jgi:hypothetical protein